MLGGRDTYLGRPLLRKECHLAATSAHYLGFGLKLEFQGRLGIARSRGSVSVELGDPKGTQLREYSAAVVFADEWRLSSGRFERGGWASESLEAIARQLSAGDEEKKVRLCRSDEATVLGKSHGRSHDRFLGGDRLPLGREHRRPC